jgi:hypothetical protein
MGIMGKMGPIKEMSDDRWQMGDGRGNCSWQSRVTKTTFKVKID